MSLVYKKNIQKAYQTKNIKYIFWIRKIKKLLEKHSTIIYLLVYIKYIKKKKTIFVTKASINNIILVLYKHGYFINLSNETVFLT
jgi:hypothetical protein